MALSILGPRELCVARELTKTHEEYLLGRLECPPPLDGLLGELTVVVGPPESVAETPRDAIARLVDEERRLGGSPRDIARRVQARARGGTVKAIYAMMSADKAS